MPLASRFLRKVSPLTSSHAPFCTSISTTSARYHHNINKPRGRVHQNVAATPYGLGSYEYFVMGQNWSEPKEMTCMRCNAIAEASVVPHSDAPFMRAVQESGACPFLRGFFRVALKEELRRRGRAETLGVLPEGWDCRGCRL
jgi:hypothetical protein